MTTVAAGFVRSRQLKTN